MANPSTFDSTTTQEANKLMQAQLDEMAEKEIISKMRQCDTTLYNEMDRMSKCPSGFSWAVHHEEAKSLDVEYQGYFTNYVGCMENLRGTFKINHSTGSVKMKMQGGHWDENDQAEAHEWMERDAWFAKYYPNCTACTSSDAPPMKQKPEKAKEKKIR